MRLKLAPKILLISAGIILALVLSFVGLSYYFSKSMYSNALNGIDMDVLKDFSETLRENYRKDGSWDAFIDNPSRWKDAADHSFFSVFFSLMDNVSGNWQSGPDFPGGSESRSSMERPEWDFPFGSFAQRLSLLDAEKSSLIEAEILNVDASYQAVELDGLTVGWLRVGKINLDILPLARYFFDQQLKIVFFSATVGGIVAFILAILLSRQITTPIKRLTVGADQIARREFNNNAISINTGDELQELAESFNRISVELGQYHALQKQWLTNISHELRAPLTLLVGEIYSVCDNLTRCDEKTAEYLQGQVMHVIRIADDLCQLCQKDEMGFRLNCQILDLQELMRYQVQRFSSSFDNNRILVTEEYTADPVHVTADGDRSSEQWQCGTIRIARGRIVDLAVAKNILDRQGVGQIPGGGVGDQRVLDLVARQHRRGGGELRGTRRHAPALRRPHRRRPGQRQSLSHAGIHAGSKPQGNRPQGGLIGIPARKQTCSKIYATAPCSVSSSTSPAPGAMPSPAKPWRWKIRRLARSLAPSRMPVPPRPARPSSTASCAARPMA